MSSFFDTLKTETLAAQQKMLSAPVFAQCQRGEIERKLAVNPI